jgi:hypothetical protein
MINDEMIASDWRNLDSIDDILTAVRQHEMDIMTYLADTVASLCNIERNDMLRACSEAHLAQPRWLFWYAYRYMTGETLEKVSEMTERCCGHRFTPNGIGQCVNKMSQMISSEPMWTKRWTIIKRIIKLRDTDVKKNSDNTITITVPRELKDIINIEIKEK